MCIKNLIIIIIGLISLTRTNPTVLEFSRPGYQKLFPAMNRQYTYVVKSNVSTGTLTPIESNSYWTLEGRLLVEVGQLNFVNDRIRLKLDNLKTSVYSKNHGYSSYQSPKQVEYLEQPWEVDYADNGYLNDIYVSSEPVWVTNMKRALSVNFQMGVKTAVSAVEPCIEPNCKAVIYLWNNNTVRKYDSASVYPFEYDNWSSVPLKQHWNYAGSNVPYVSYIPEVTQTPDSITGTERVYELDDRKGILSLDLRSSYQYKTHDHILFVSTDLSLYYDADRELNGTHKLDLNKTSLKYEDHTYSDPSNSIRNLTQEELKNKTYGILLKIARKGIDADNVVRNASLIHSLDFIELLHTMCQLKYQYLNLLFKDMVIGTSYDVETAKNVFLEVLPHVRTYACARFIKQLVLEQKEKIEDATLLSLIRKLPFNVANHSQALLEELEVFTRLGLDYSQDIRHAGILSYATLVSKADEAMKVDRDYMDYIVVKYFRMYSDCPQYLDRLIWLQGLCNIEYRTQSYPLAIFSDGNKERHERLWAGLAYSHNLAKGELESFLRVLIDKHENIQLRIAALHTIMSSEVTARDFLFVHNFIKACDNNQLKRFWYTTIKNIESTKFYDDYRTISYFVPFVANQVTNPDTTYWATNNYIITSEDETGSASFQVLSVGESLSALPAFVAFKLSTGGRYPYRLAAYIIAEGVTTNMFKKLHTFNAKELNVDQLVELLRKMNVQLVQPEKVHIDLVIKIHDKTVYATHINQTRFESWNGEDLTKSIEDFLRFGSHINQQIVYYPFQLDINIPTELGTPIRLRSTVASFTSIRGNLTAPSSKDLTWRNDLHIRHQSTSITSLSTDAPLLQSEHTARVQQSMVAHVPMKFDVTVSPTARSFELKWPNPGAQHGGIAMHSRAQIAMESSKGVDAYTVTSGENKYGVDETGIFFDCERPMTGTEVLEKLLSSKANGYDFLTNLKPSVIILNTILLITSPTPGSCGVILPPRRLLQAGNNLLEVRLKMEDLNLNADDRVKVKLSHYLSFRDNGENGKVYFNISGYSKLESSAGNMTCELLLVGHQPHALDPSRKIWKLCLKEQDISHGASDQDITTHPASYEGRLTLTFKSGDSTLTCPTSGSQLRLQYEGAPTNVYGNLERYFEVKVVGKELPKLDLLSDSGFGTQTPLGQLVASMDRQPLNVTAVVKEKNGVASVSINNGAEMQFKSENFAWLLDSWSNMQIMKKFGLYRECRVQESTVQTLSGAMDPLPPMECSQNLILADCTNSPRFAIQRLKHGGIKMYTGGNYVSVVTAGGSAVVTVNGHQPCPAECVYPSDEPIYDFKVSRKGDAVKLHSRLSGVQVYYRYSETVILVPHSYMSTGCGACAGQQDYNLC